jgi:hypothetical protein
MKCLTIIKDNMSSSSRLYSDLKTEALQLKLEGKIPKTVLFAGGSAFCRNVENTLFDGYISMIDKMLMIPERTNYDNREMRRMKDRMEQIIEAIKDPAKCNINEKEWADTKQYFSNFKLVN